MARLAGVDLPRNKRMEIALTYIYGIGQPRATRILDDKIAEVHETGADMLVTANPGCMMQLQRGIQRSGLTAQVRHVVELLDEAYQST